MLKKIIFLGLFLGLTACSSLKETQENYHDNTEQQIIKNSDIGHD